MQRLLATIGLTAMLLAGCAQQPVTPVENVERYQDRLAAVENWELRGKMNLRVPGDSETVRVRWDNQGSQYAIRLSGALGMGATWIRGNEKSVRLEQSGEEAVVARTPEDLVYRELGREIPISELRYWVRGLPAPEPSPRDVGFTPEGTLAHLQQSGWSLQYSDYRAVNNWNLPGKIVATRDDLRLTLLVGNWSLEAAPR